MYKADKIVDNSKTVTRQKAQFVASLFPHTQKEGRFKQGERKPLFSCTGC